jgi:hypothetical protein
MSLKGVEAYAFINDTPESESSAGDFGLIRSLEPELSARGRGDLTLVKLRKQ